MKSWFFSRKELVSRLKVGRLNFRWLKGCTASEKWEVYVRFGWKKEEKKRSVCMFVWVCKRRKGREMRWECVWACSLALTGVSFPGMNNSNECNGNHAMLVILFSVACPSAPPQPPTSLQEQENKLQEQRHVSHISTVISLHYSQSKRRDIRQSGNTYRSTAALFHLSPNTPQHTHTPRMYWMFSGHSI